MKDMNINMSMNGNSNASPARCGAEPMDYEVIQARGHGLGLGY